MKFDYDITILGCREAGIFAAYELIRLELSGELETALPGLYAAGDSAGVTRGLAQAGASDVQAARAVYRRLEQ